VIRGFVAHSPAMRILVAEIERYAAADANVLITGETGVGKDAAARALHQSGPRRAEPFVEIDCPSLPPTLIESELFGFERGAFTDASVAKAGRFELAGSGTIYLDNVGELPLDVQAKLLRLVEEKRLERLGGVASMPVRARIVASADARIEHAVTEGTFRDDLYHRLRVLPLRIPPLRERRADIRLLATRFIRDAARRAGRDTPTLTAGAAVALEAHAWPGNVRQLRHVIEQTMVALDPSRDAIDTGDLPPDVQEDSAVLYGTQGTRPTLDALERRYVEVVLRETRGRQTEAARILGISRKALWEKRKKYGLL
jgi:DNA-binding NtrC family response regulator